VRAFDRLDLASYLLYRSPTSLGTLSRPVIRNEWTEYHFTAFTSALATVGDCCLLLVADVYDLGLPPKQCTLEAITTNRWVRNSAAAKALRLLHRKLQEHRERRNRYLHRGDEADFGELTSSQHLDDLRMVTWLHSLKDLSIEPRLLQVLWKFELTDLRPLLTAATTECVDKTVAILSSLERPFEAHSGARTHK
jgi:hypothetical protein